VRSNAVNNVCIKGTFYCRRERTKEKKRINETLANMRIYITIKNGSVDILARDWSE